MRPSIKMTGPPEKENVVYLYNGVLLGHNE
jgi:hypothetical protein